MPSECLVFSVLFRYFCRKRSLTGIVGFIGETLELGAFDDCHCAGTGESVCVQCHSENDLHGPKTESYTESESLSQRHV